ncbi:MAG TPA: hypothetical protein VK939_00170 [Longimicrobiales bacterium]|nr:hypothetical protein [Longimicrobiales bacterium]
MLAFPFAILLVTVTLFGAGVRLAWFHVPIAAALTVAFCAWLTCRMFATHRTARFLLAVGVTAAVFTACVLLEMQVHDHSWDGQTYHALGIHELAEGWNPVREAAPEVGPYARELRYFAKGPWLAASAIYRFTGSFEGGKAFHLYFMLAACLFWVGTLLYCCRIRPLWALLAVVPIALNPVSGAQMFTYYVDGLLASLIAIVMALLILVSRRGGGALLPVLAIAVALTIGVKLNGALYVAILSGGFWIWRLFVRRAGTGALFAWLVVGALAGAGVTGFNPYVSQFAAGSATRGNPLQPLAYWSSIIDLEAQSMFPGASRVGRVARSLVARSIIWTDTVAEPKLPFTFARWEWGQFASPDVRLGGFGPLFSGALLLALATFVLLPFRRRRLRSWADLLVLAGLLVVSVLSFSGAWWARLAPQLGFVPVLIGIVGLHLVRQAGYRWVPRALIVVLCLNSVGVLAAHVSFAVGQSAVSHRQLAALRALDTAVPVPDLEGFPGVRYRLERAGVRYYETASLPCPEELQEPLTLDLLICRPEP